MYNAIFLKFYFETFNKYSTSIFFRFIAFVKLSNVEIYTKKIYLFTSYLNHVYFGNMLVIKKSFDNIFKELIKINTTLEPIKVK